MSASGFMASAGGYRELLAPPYAWTLAMLDADDLIAQFEPRAHEVIDEFKQFVFINFDLFDKNKDGFLSRAELLAAIYETDRPVRELAFLNFILVRMREIAESYQEPWADKPDCISKSDLEVYFSKLKESGTAALQAHKGSDQSS